MVERRVIPVTIVFSKCAIPSVPVRVGRFCMSQPDPAYLFYLIDGLEPAVPIEIVDVNNRRVFIVE